MIEDGIESPSVAVLRHDLRRRWVASRLSFGAAAAGLGLLAFGLGAAAATRKPARHIVVMEAVSFQPDPLTVRSGDAVVWQNGDPFPHTATSTADGFDSGIIAPATAWTEVARTKGTFPYVCTLHPTMRGVLRVD